MSGLRDPLLKTLFAEIFRDTHRYAPGVDHRRPTLAGAGLPRRRRLVHSSRERTRDAIERAAMRAGFAHRHFDPVLAGERLERIVDMADGLAATYASLADERSRRAFVDVLKWRVLGPFHATLDITPDQYRARQEQVDLDLRVEAGTVEVSDPYFSPLSLYNAPLPGSGSVSLHSHSVDVVSVFLLEQYSYSAGSVQVGVEPGDRVLDVGGCWGDTALYFAGRTGPDGTVHTFEFDPENLVIMRTNLSLNPELAGRIRIVESALWDRSGETLEFAQAGRMSKVMPSQDPNGPHRVETITVDEFLAAEEIPSIEFVKMDVEGAELRVLEGARGSIAASKPKLAIAAYHKDDDLVRIPELIASIDSGYRFYLKTSSPVEDETVLFAVAS